MINRPIADGSHWIGTHEDITERLLAVQAQDLRSARLAIRARTNGLAAVDVDRALTDERALVIVRLVNGAWTYQP